MKEPEFYYGPIARGIYTALLWLTVLIGFTAPSFIGFYLLFLLFLTFGLRPLLVKTGLYGLYSRYSAHRSEKLNDELSDIYHKDNAKQLAKRDKHLAEMRDKLKPKT